MVLAIDSPVGSAGDTVYVRVPVPPLPVTGRSPPGNAVANDTFAVLATLGVATASVSGPLTLKLNSFDDRAPAVSLTVIVYVAVALVPVATPLTAPVRSARASPAGSDGVIEKYSGLLPPAAVTAVKAQAAPTEQAYVGALSVVVSGGFTVRATG